MSKWFAVHCSLDQIKVKTDQKQEWYVYFDTEKEARVYLVERANKDLCMAEAAVVRALRRLTKCEKKFGWKLGD